MRTYHYNSVIKRKLECLKFRCRNIEWVCCFVDYLFDGTVRDYVDGFIWYVVTKLNKSHGRAICDRYYKNSIKDRTCKARSASRQHQLNLNIPLSSQKVILKILFCYSRNYDFKIFLVLINKIKQWFLAGSGLSSEVVSRDKFDCICFTTPYKLGRINFCLVPKNMLLAITEL